MNIPLWRVTVGIRLGESASYDVSTPDEQTAITEAEQRTRRDYFHPTRIAKGYGKATKVERIK